MEIKQAEKKLKNGNCNSVCRDIVFVCRDTISSRPKELCRNQQLYVATKSKTNFKQKKNLYCDKEFYVATLLKKNEKKTVMIVLNSVVTKIKVESKGAMSRQYFLCSNIKSSRLTDELYHDKRQLCHDRKC